MLCKQLEGSTSEKNVASTLSTISETTRNELPIQLVSPKTKAFPFIFSSIIFYSFSMKELTCTTILNFHFYFKQGIELRVEEGTTSANAKIITPSLHSKSLSSSLGQLDTSKHKTTSQDDGDGRRVVASPLTAITKPLTTQDVDVKIWQETSKTKDDQVSLNDDAVIKVSSNIENQFPNDDEFRVSEPKPSPSNKLPKHLAFQTPSIPSEGNSSQIMEKSSSPSIVMSKLRQLVSENYLDYENLSLLTDFLVKHPSLLLKDTSLSNRYKGYAYGCLAELLQFLQTHSVFDVLGSSRSKFVKLLQDVRSFAFDKAWLDSLERRALFSDIQVSQNEFQKLLDSKQQVSKEVEVLRFKIDVLSQNVEDLKHQLTSSETVLKSIIQKEEQVLETRAALSAPLGY
ncbi:hypothetical protein MtrunA17_Chr3g0107261 [Medicago truncatula]|uniref:CC-NBS-LRR resistance protein n=1 Tax=Medicago truncatula TaxID=3880 RepID=A0A396IU01_MEDTR|nr:hypothetical protein MtrunA17_Chr3g0107261 [Medicago truncatula]